MTTQHTIMESCCTCATLFSDLAGPAAAEYDEKQPTGDRRLPCCSRVICSRCIRNNARFASYCPYCQITTSKAPSVITQGLKEPPPYGLAVPTPADAPPPYEAHPPKPPPPLADNEKGKGGLTGKEEEEEEIEEDTLHFLDHAHDTVASLSLRYGVPAHALRAANRLGSDHLLAARQTILIPGAYYKGGVSLSPQLVEGEEEGVRKSKIRRWQVACKEADYDVAVLYLENAGYDLADAVEAYFADEAWAKEHPLEHDKNGKTGRDKGKRAAGSGRIPWNRVSQAAFLRRAGPSNSNEDAKR